jgi:uncharacterized protein YbjT (DUF2867 family)
MRIAVLGGTGTLGRHVVDALAARGHDVSALSRSTTPSVDLTTGEGLDAALEGIDVVVDASNGPPGRKAEPILVDGSRRLLEAERRAGVGHHVCASIVGIERIPTAYYEVKVRQEQAVEAGDVPWTIVRATQFHDLVAATFASAARFRLIPAPHVPVQPIDVETVAGLIADVAENAPHTGRVEIAGPKVESARDLARTWREHTKKRAAIVPFPLPGKLSRALRAGHLTNPDRAAEGSPTFAEWLAGASSAADRG